MAIGDAGAAKGLVIYAATQAHSLGYQNDNQRADDIAAEIDARALGDSNLSAAITALGNSKQNSLGFTPVRQTSLTVIGFRSSPASETGTGFPRPIVSIDGSEYELPLLLELNAVIARLNRNGIGA